MHTVYSGRIPVRQLSLKVRREREQAPSIVRAMLSISGSQLNKPL